MPQKITLHNPSTIPGYLLVSTLASEARSAGTWNINLSKFYGETDELDR